MTPSRFLLAFVFLGTGTFFFVKNLSRWLVPPSTSSIMTKFEQFLCEHFRNILERSFRDKKTVNNHAIRITG